MIENNRECYHCAGTHPELTASFLPEDFGFCAEGLSEESLQALDEYEQRNAAAKKSWEDQGFVCDAVEHLDVDAVTQFRTCEGLGAEAGWTGPVGRLSLELLSESVPDFREREVFTCGPKGYMDAVKALLKNGGFDFAHYHEESFDIAALMQEPLIEAAPSVEQGQALFTVTLSRSGKIFSMPATQTVLSAAKKAGAIVPSSCSQGVCARPRCCKGRSR